MWLCHESIYQPGSDTRCRAGCTGSGSPRTRRRARAP
jgi:hypothetical protein